MKNVELLMPLPLPWSRRRPPTLRCLLVMTLLLLSCVLEMASCSGLSAKMSKRNKAKKTNSELEMKKRQENLCPLEYRLCWCDFINANENDNLHAASSSGANPKSSLSQSAANTASSSGGSSSSSSQFTSNAAVMIDCQFNKNNNEPSLSNRSSSSSASSSSGEILSEVPRIAAQNPAKHKHLSQITYLDLSQTAIKEIPTDAFNGLIGLKTIVITNCAHLQTIRMFAFRNLPNLKSLIISSNPMLAELEPHSFGSLRNLNYLSLSMNRLERIDGYVFSSSSAIKTIDFIGNPIKKIKSHAFHGLRNVSDLLLSVKQSVTPIEHIEGDSFISTAFVDQLFLEGIPTKVLVKNAFRGLSFCKSLLLTSSHVQEIEANAFHRANNIGKLSLLNARVKVIRPKAFNGAFNIDLVDLRGNYLTKLNKSTFGDLILPRHQHAAASANMDNVYNTNTNTNSSVVVLNMQQQQHGYPLARASEHYVKKILFEQNPLECDCALAWLLANKKTYAESISLPEICAGPKGYDCLRVTDLVVEHLPCADREQLVAAGLVAGGGGGGVGGTSGVGGTGGGGLKNYHYKVPCVDLVFDIRKESDIVSIAVPKGKKIHNSQGKEKGEPNNGSENQNGDNNNDENDEDDYSNEEYYDENSFVEYDTDYEHGAAPSSSTSGEQQRHSGAKTTRVEADGSGAKLKVDNGGLLSPPSSSSTNERLGSAKTTTTTLMQHNKKAQPTSTGSNGGGGGAAIAALPSLSSSSIVNKAHNNSRDSGLNRLVSSGGMYSKSLPLRYATPLLALVWFATTVCRML